MNDDDEEEQQVSSSVESPGALCVPSVKSPPAPASNPFLSAFLKCEGGLQEGINQSPIYHQCQHTFNRNNNDLKRPEDNPQYKCVSLPEAHSGRTLTPKPLCHGPDIQISLTHSQLHQSLRLPPKLSRMQLPESVVKSLETNPKPLSDIFNTICARALAKDSQTNLQHEQAASGSNKEAEAPSFPAVQDCTVTFYTKQYTGRTIQWPGFTGNRGQSCTEARSVAFSQLGEYGGERAAGK